MIKSLSKLVTQHTLKNFTSHASQAQEINSYYQIKTKQNNSFQFQNPFINKKEEQNYIYHPKQTEDIDNKSNEILNSSISQNNETQNNAYFNNLSEYNIKKQNISQPVLKISHISIPRINNIQKNIKVKNTHREQIKKSLDINSIDSVWKQLQQDAYQRCQEEPMLKEYFQKKILQHKTLDGALCHNIAYKLSTDTLNFQQWRSICVEVFLQQPQLLESMKEDLLIIKNLDAGWVSHINSFLYQKGYSGLSMARVGQYLYKQNRKELAFLIQNRVSELYSMDIHPGSTFESGIFFDHASGLVIGETARIGSGTYILHNVTLGASGKEPHGSDRHPKLGKNCYIGSNVSIIGNINIGDNVKIGAGSVCLKDIPANSTCVGIPAKILNLKK